MVAVFMRIDDERYGPFMEVNDAVDFASLSNPYLKTHIGNFGESDDANKLKLPWVKTCQGHTYFIYGV